MTYWKIKYARCTKTIAERIEIIWLYASENRWAGILGELWDLGLSLKNNKTVNFSSIEDHILLTFNKMLLHLITTCKPDIGFINIIQKNRLVAEG